MSEGKVTVFRYGSRRPASRESFGKVHRWLRSVFDSGEHAECPMCLQRVKRYRYTVDGSMAAALLAFYLTYGTQLGKWSEVRNIITDPLNDLLPGSISPGTKFSILRYWGLIEDPDPGKFRSDRLDDLENGRSDGGHRSMYRVTDKGVQWIRGEIEVEKYVYMYNQNKLKRPKDSGKELEVITFEEAWRKKFKLYELMEIRESEPAA